MKENKIAIPEHLFNRLLAIKTILSGHIEKDELYCAYEEMDYIMSCFEIDVHFERKQREHILKCFYAQLPDGLSLEDFAKGFDMTFNYRGNIYYINTFVDAMFRTNPIEHYYNKLDQKVLTAVLGELKNEG